jgi:hypothetical protein
MFLVPQSLLLALGDDIMLPEVPDLAKKVVFGCTNGRHFNKEILT